jgi:MFS family permease
VSLTSGQRWRGVAAATGCISIVGLMTGLTWPLLSLRLDAQGVDSRLIGLNAAVQALAIIAISPLAPRLVGRLGPVKTMYACIAAALASLLLLPLVPDVYAWFPIRFVLGASVAAIFIVGETWIIQVAPPDMRGRIVGLFGFVWSGCFAAGPLVIRITGVAGWTPFLVGAAIVLVAALPLPFARAGAPTIERVRGLAPWRLLQAAPATMLAVFLLAVVDSVNDSFLPLYGIRNGLAQGVSVTALTVLLAGITLVQLPVGWLADHTDRRRLLIGTVIAIIGLQLLLPFAAQRAWTLWITALALGCAGGGLWAVSLVLVGERYQGADIAAANTARGVFYGIGAFAGPSAAGFALRLWDPHGVPAVIIVVGLLFLPVAILGERAARTEPA